MFDRTDNNLLIIFNLQDNLLLYNHARLMATDPRASGKEYLVTTMFRMYDINGNEVLEGEELDQVIVTLHTTMSAQGLSVSRPTIYCISPLNILSYTLG